MQKNKSMVEGLSIANIVAIVLLIVLVGFAGNFLGKYSKNISKNTEKEVASVQSVVYFGEDGKSALELLKNNTNEIQTQDSSLGVFVLSINGVSNTDNQFWMFYVNDQLSSVAADQYQTKNEDKIEWRYEKLE